MDRPPKSPDLKPIEHVWGTVGRAIVTRNLPPRTIQELKTALLNEWEQLLQALIKLPYFLYDITLRGLYGCRRGLYP
ncbi:hypothetical protein X975_24479, partial [Stegodyphus mimosarum]